MKTEKIQIDKLRLNEANPRTIKDEKFKKLIKSIKEFPQMLEIRPIVLDNDMTVLGGNMRLRACIEAGLTHVPVIRASELTDEQKQRFIIADNVGFGEWDWEALANEWDAGDLEAWGLDVPGFAIMPDESELIAEQKNKPATMKITFPTPEDLQKCEPQLQEVLNRLCTNAYYSVSAGEI